MSTVRIQVRRGTAAQWTSVNPILAAGEMGVESDTNLFKFGNGSSTWTALAYANNSDVAIGEISQDAINTALTMGAGLSKTYNDGANTITINVDSNVVALKSYVDAQVSGLANTVDTDYIPLSDRGVAGGVASLDNSGKVPANQLNISETIQDVIGSTLVSGRGSNVSYNDANDTLTLTAGLRGQGSVSVINATDNNDLIVKLNPVVAADTKFTGPLVEVGTVTSTDINATNVTVSGNLTVTGTSTTVNSTNVSIDDPMIHLGENNASNAVDLGFVATFNNGTHQHSGLVRDASDGKWKLFSGVTAEPTTVIDFTTYTKDGLEIGALVADSARIGNVTNNEIQHLDGVGWPIQGQIDEKLAISTAASTYAPIASPMFTGTVTLPEGTVTSYMIANGTITNEDIGTYAEIAQSKVANLVANLAEKAPTFSPTFTGTIVLPGTTSIGSVSATEIGYLDGVTSSIQTQLAPVQGLVDSVYALESDLNTAENTISSLESSVGSINTTTTSLQTQINTKASSASLTAHEADTTNIHGIADTSVLATATTVATAKSEAIAAAGTAADTKVSTAVAALTKSSVGLANVDNTSDANKPVSTATQTALNLKANLNAPTFTGTVTSSNDLVVDGNLTVNGTTFNASSTSITIEDNLVQLAHQNPANSVDLGLVVAYNDGAAKHAGIARDVSDDKWKLFKGVISEPTTTVNFTQGSLDNLAVAALEATTVTPSAGIVFSDGTQTKAGVPSITAISAVRSASETLVAGEQDKFVPVSGAVQITLPATGYATGQSIDFWQSVGTGASFASTNGVVGTPGLKFRTTNSVVTALKISSGWLVFGDLSA